MRAVGAAWVGVGGGLVWSVTVCASRGERGTGAGGKFDAVPQQRPAAAAIGVERDTVPFTAVTAALGAGRGYRDLAAGGAVPDPGALICTRHLLFMPGHWRIRQVKRRAAATAAALVGTTKQPQVTPAPALPRRHPCAGASPRAGP